MMDIAGGETRSTALNDKTSNAVLGSCPDNSHICEAAVCDPHFRAIQDVTIPVMTSSRTHPARITAGIWFGQTDTADHFAASHTREPVLFLFRGTVSRDWEHGERTLNRDKGAQTTIASL